jgi:hypothetical protein
MDIESQEMHMGVPNHGRRHMRQGRRMLRSQPMRLLAIGMGVQHASRRHNGYGDHDQKHGNANRFVWQTKHAVSLPYLLL